VLFDRFDDSDNDSDEGLQQSTVDTGDNHDDARDDNDNLLTASVDVVSASQHTVTTQADEWTERPSKRRMMMTQH